MIKHILTFLLVIAGSTTATESGLIINDLNYFDLPGLSVMVFHEDYPEGHQGGITIIQNGVRVAANGDVRLEPAPGQWQPVPKVGERTVDRNEEEISVRCRYPHPDKNRKGFNPIIYPDLELVYTVRVKAEGRSFRIEIDLDEPLLPEWVGRAGFNLELFPGDLFGKSFLMDDSAGYFPRQLNGPAIYDEENGWINKPLATGNALVVAPECDRQRMTIRSMNGELQLIDGRMHHNNGWFIVRTPLPAGKTKRAVEWLVSPHVLPDWKFTPVVHVSQVGYLPGQHKIAVIETDERQANNIKASLIQITETGDRKTVLEELPVDKGPFYRNRYFQFDFSTVDEQGLYVMAYGDRQSNPFFIGEDVFDRHVWQPALEYFLPVQMCHMRVNDRYRVWHGLCHMDDALMAPTDTLHFDGYRQGSSTLTQFEAYERVPGLDVGGWHDAGDYDLRVESQAQTVRVLSMAYETFGLDYDQTTVDQASRIVELHRPDGKPDALQQIEHGVLSILAGYRALGRLYRGIICSGLRQYVLLGDGSVMTDNTPYTGDNPAVEADDRWVFTEENPYRELHVAACMAAAYRPLKEYDGRLAEESLQVAEILWEKNKQRERMASLKADLLCELILSSGKAEYIESLLALKPELAERIDRVAWSIGRILHLIEDNDFTAFVRNGVQAYQTEGSAGWEANPFGVPYVPHQWGPGWMLQKFGVRQYFLHRHFPDLVTDRYFLNALNFILGVHPGTNTASYVSGVGRQSLEVAYGVNRADWSFIPGGSVSGTGLILPDFFELKEWPFFWQQTEYMISGAATNFMFLVLAAKDRSGIK